MIIADSVLGAVGWCVGVCVFVLGGGVCKLDIAYMWYMAMCVYAGWRLSGRKED